jgi:hypothetical protein
LTEGVEVKTAMLGGVVIASGLLAVMWVAVRGGVTACVAILAILVGIQVAGYGIPLKAVDLVCALVLAGVAGFFHYHLIDGLALLDAGAVRRHLGRAGLINEMRTRVNLTLTGLVAFLFSALSVVMLVSLLAP